MNERNLIPEAIEYLSKSDEERILYCKKDHWIGYGAAVKLIEILEDKFLDPPHLTFSKKSKNQILHSTNPFVKGF